MKPGDFKRMTLRTHVISTMHFDFSLLWPIDTKLAVWVADIKRQLRIATQVSVIKVKVTVTKNRNLVSPE